MTRSAALDYARTGVCGSTARVPHELGATALFLASDESSFNTGAVIPVSGSDAASGSMPVSG